MCGGNGVSFDSDVPPDALLIMRLRKWSSRPGPDGAKGPDISSSSTGKQVGGGVNFANTCTGPEQLK
jgi:hypothetical protein